MAGSDAVFFASEQVHEKFREGGVLFDTGAYQIYACRREVPGECEIHEYAIDVMYGVKGQASVTTGGELVAPREVGPGELRAPDTEGGTQHEFHEGDVLAVPNGVPHQFTAVSDPFLYYVVKIAVQPTTSQATDA